MANQRDPARLMVAFSAFVVAVCAVVVTVKVLATSSVPVQPQRVLDPAAVERAVSFEVAGGDTTVRVSCPVSVVVQVGNKFDCQYWDAPNTKTVQVTVLSDQGELSIDTDPG